MNVETLIALIKRIEKADAASYDLDDAIGRATAGPSGNYASRPYSASMDAAITLLPEGSDWRRFTPRSCSVYAASPYNAKAEVRHDGYGPTPAAQLCAAIFKMHLAKAKQMEKARG